MNFKITWIDCNIVVEFFNELNIDQLIQVSNIIYGDSRLDEMKYQIFDFTKVSNVNLTSKEVAIISALDTGATNWNKSVKVASIATDSYMKQMINEYTKGMQDTKWESMTFENIIEAKKWVSL